MRGIVFLPLIRSTLEIRDNDIELPFENFFSTHEIFCINLEPLPFLCVMSFTSFIIILLRASKSMNELLLSSGHDDLENTINILHLIVLLYESLYHA